MCFTFTSCGNNENKADTFTVTLKNGTVEEMTYQQLSDLYDNELKLEDYLEAEVIGSGKLESIEKASNGTATMKVDFMNFDICNVPVEVAKTFNKGDIVDVKGTLYRVFGAIVYLNGAGYY